MRASPDAFSQNDLLLDRLDLRRRFKCSTATLKRYEARGLRALRLGPRLVRYRLSDVIAFEERTVETR